MGLFTKKDPCAICGGKVSGLFPHKIDRQLICKECYGVVDLPSGVENNMTLDDFQNYRAFREENQQLRNNFRVNERPRFSYYEFAVDTANRLFCTTLQLDKTIFLGEQIKSFSIYEDMNPLFEGGPNGLICYTSTAPEQARSLTPQIVQYKMQREMFHAMERQAERNDPEHRRPRPAEPSFDIPAPFDKYYLEIQFDHPYWREFRQDEMAPRFSSWDPDVGDYLREYTNQYQKLEHLARTLMALAFPGAPECSADEYYSAAAQPVAAVTPTAGAVDAVAEIKKYKELLDQQLITEEEFAAKKRQLMGI